MSKDMTSYSRETKPRRYVKGYGFSTFAKSLPYKHGKIFDTATKTWIDSTKSASRKVVQKTAEATELTGNKIEGKIVKLKPVPEGNSRNDY